MEFFYNTTRRGDGTDAAAPSASASLYLPSELALGLDTTSLLSRSADSAQTLLLLEQRGVFARMRRKPTTRGWYPGAVVQACIAQATLVANVVLVILASLEYYELDHLNVLAYVELALVGAYWLHSLGFGVYAAATLLATEATLVRAAAVVCGACGLALPYVQLFFVLRYRGAPHVVTWLNSGRPWRFAWFVHGVLWCAPQTLLQGVALFQVQSTLQLHRASVISSLFATGRCLGLQAFYTFHGSSGTLITELVPLGAQLVWAGTGVIVYLTLPTWAYLAPAAVAGFVFLSLVGFLSVSLCVGRRNADAWRQMVDESITDPSGQIILATNSVQMSGRQGRVDRPRAFGGVCARLSAGRVLLAAALVAVCATVTPSAVVALRLCGQQRLRLALQALLVCGAAALSAYVWYYQWWGGATQPIVPLSADMLVPLCATGLGFVLFLVGALVLALQGRYMPHDWLIVDWFRFFGAGDSDADSDDDAEVAAHSGGAARADAAGARLRGKPPLAGSMYGAVSAGAATVSWPQRASVARSPAAVPARTGSWRSGRLGDATAASVPSSSAPFASSATLATSSTGAPALLPPRTSVAQPVGITGSGRVGFDSYGYGYAASEGAGAGAGTGAGGGTRREGW